jgi:hypothetical protein
MNFTTRFEFKIENFKNKKKEKRKRKPTCACWAVFHCPTGPATP